MTVPNEPLSSRAGSPVPAHVLHISNRDTLRPIRDQILRLCGYTVVSTRTYEEGMQIFHGTRFDLVLIDVEEAESVHAAERLCSEIKTSHAAQLVAFVCNWRVAVLTDCPDEILRTEFDPEAFVAGVRAMLA